jgi:hypothetical protein
MAAYDPTSGTIRLFWASPKWQRPRCEARCRDGHLCRARAVWDRQRDRPRNGRCRMHGGLSTGPKTAAGRDRIREANRRRWQQWRSEQEVRHGEAL